MIAEHTLSGKRLYNAAYMILAALAISVAFAVRYRLMIDQIIILVVLDLLFVPLLILAVCILRRDRRLNTDDASDCTLFTVVFITSAVLYFIYSFIPAYFAPVMFPAVFLCLVSGETIGLSVAMYFNIILCMFSDCSYYELAAYGLLAVGGCLIAVVLSRKKYQIFASAMAFSLSLVIPVIFYYLNHLEMHYQVFVYGVASGLITVVMLLCFYNKLEYRVEEAVSVSLQHIIDEKYPLVRDIRNYSEIDYLHAVKVSQIAYSCAQELGLDAPLAATAGFYYRLGRLEGEPFVENSIVLAQANCFPTKLVQILSEYNGELNLPSTKESAVVHIVDAVVTKFDLLDKDTFSSTWNHDIVIYQTLNEKSSSGIYDESGLGMNQFLKLREYLVKGVDLF